MDPAPLLSSFGKDFTKPTPETERAVANCQHRRAHAAPLEITQHFGPRLGRFPKAIPDGNQLLASVGAHAQQDQLQTKVRAAEAGISTEVANAYAEYATAREIVEAIEGQMLTQAQSVRTTTEYSYRRGEASFVEFLDAVRAFNETMQSYNEARAGFARSLYAIDSISGRVTP